MAGYLGTKAVLLSTTAADVVGNAEIGGDLTVGGAFTSQGIDDNASATAMTLDASGNVGIGVVPPAWSVIGPALTVGNASLASYSSGTAHLSYMYNNAYYDGSNEVYKSTGPAALFQISENSFKWFNAISGSAGTNVNFSERMRIDSSGNLLVGTTTSQEKVTIAVSDNEDGLSIWNTSTAATPNKNPLLNFYATDTVGTVKQTARILAENVEMDAVNSNLVFYTRGSDSNDERMRINSSGTIDFGPSGAVGGVSMLPNYSAGAALLYWNRTNTTAVTTALRFDNQGIASGSITYNNNSAAYNTSSDYRLKTDAQPMTGASARVQALKPINFAWKADGSRTDGFLAHEAQEVVPEAVHGAKDAMRDEEYEVTPAVYEDVIIPAVLDEEGNELEAERTEQRLVSEAVMGTRSVPDYQGIDQSKLVPLLTAALQEALTEIADLKARVTALEAV